MSTIFCLSEAGGKGYGRAHQMTPTTRRPASRMLKVIHAGMVVLFCGLTGLSPLSAAIGQQQQEQMTIGVLDLEAGGVEDSEARAISARLRLFLGRTGVFEVIERNQMESIMAEVGFQLSGACNTNECIIQAGEILGARKMVAGSVSKVGTLYSLQVRIVDIETSRIDHEEFLDVPGGIEEVLQTATETVSNALAARVSGQSAPVPGQPVSPATPTTAQISFETTPAGAAIIIDGQSSGQVTPAILYLPAGTHELTLRLTGYTENAQSFQVVGGQDRTINTSLTEIYVGQAQLTIQNSLLGATLRVSGTQATGAPLNNPQESVELIPGHYQLKVRAPGYAPWSREIDLADGDNSVIPVTLTPKSRFTAGVLALIPGVGHFYANRPGKGMLMLVATVGSIAYGAGQFDSYATSRDEYDQLVSAYRAATTYQDLTAIKADMDIKYVEVQESHNKLGTVVGIAGAVWLFNIIDASLLMPRLRNASGGSPVPEMDLGARNGRLTFSLKVNF
ncbi:DUF6677 family protein [Gemmatimonadota bacterium]